VRQCANGREAIAAIAEEAPDLMFLDIQMPGLSGLEVVAQVPQESMPMVVFVTAFDRYAINAFEARAIDYLLKPWTTRDWPPPSTGCARSGSSSRRSRSASS
jgi:two-component system LytT family response regulator